jgi:hypothetical protein
VNDSHLIGSLNSLDTGLNPDILAEEYLEAIIEFLSYGFLREILRWGDLVREERI